MPLFVDFHYKGCSQTHSKSTNVSPTLGLNILKKKKEEKKKVREAVGDTNLTLETLKIYQER